MLQETHIKSCDSDKVNKELKINTDKYEVIHDGKYYAKKACHGVSLLVNRKKGLEVISFKTSGHGRWIIADVKISNCVYTVINLYAPSGDNADTAQFFESFHCLLKDKKNIIMGGDTNAIWYRSDTTNPNRKISPFTKEFLKKNKLFVNVQANRNSYTYIKGDSKSSIDKFILDNSTIAKCCKTEVYENVIISDHRPISMKLIDISKNDTNNHSNDNTKLKRNTKQVDMHVFNDKLLQDKKHTDCINNIIQDEKNTWANVKQQLLQYSLENKDKKSQLECDVKKKNKKWSIYMQELEQANEEEQLELLNDLNKPSKKFTQSLSNKSNNNNKNNSNKIATLINNNNYIINGEDNINKHIFSHYSSFFKKKKRSKFNNFYNVKKLTQQHKMDISKPISRKEISEAINSIGVKAPGVDGIGPRVYKKFNKIIASKLEAYYTDTNKDYKSFAKGKIILIHKSGDVKVLGNYRPITLLNVDYRIFALIYFRRLEIIRNQIMNTKLNSYQKGVNLTQNVQVIDLQIRKKLKNYILNTDYSKAFDSIHHEYIKEILMNHNFPNDFIEMINKIYDNATSAVVGCNNKLTDDVDVQRGVRQGDSLSVFLFPLVLNPLLEKINKLEKNQIVYAHADDVCYLFKTKKALKYTLKLIDRFTKISGLQLNKKKCKLITSDNKLQHEYKSIPIVKEFKYLGFQIGKAGIINTYDDDIRYICDKMENMKHKYYLKTKIIILNTYLLAKLYYKLQLSPLSEEQLHEIQQMIKWFLFYKSKIGFEKFDKGYPYRAKPSLQRLYKSKAEGGYGLINLDLRSKTCAIKVIVNVLNGKMKLCNIFKNDFRKIKKLQKLKVFQPPILCKITKKNMTAVNNIYISRYYDAMKALHFRLEYIGKKGEYVTVFDKSYNYNYTGKIHKINRKSPFDVEIDICDATTLVTDMYSKDDKNEHLYVGSNSKRYHLVQKDTLNFKRLAYKIRSRDIEQLVVSSKQPSYELLNISKFCKLRGLLANHLEQFIVKLINRSNSTRNKSCYACKSTNDTNHFLDCVSLTKYFTLFNITNFTQGRQLINITEPTPAHIVFLQFLWLCHIHWQYNEIAPTDEDATDMICVSIAKQNKCLKAKKKLLITDNPFRLAL